MSELREMTVFEKAVLFMRWLSNRAGAGYEYDRHWGEKFRAEEINEAFESIKNQCDADFWNSVFALSEHEKQLLGFCKWSDEEKEMCIPIWIWACLPDDMPIGGNAGGKLKKDLDNDTRFGCVWWRV
ncbi:MAG: hypothetical protein J6T08_08825 [Lentisphaeria bacterium]|nr:hypothetical protein [Lentisphaeria bacterium]